MQNIIISNSENISGSIRSEGNILGIIKLEDRIKIEGRINKLKSDYQKLEDKHSKRAVDLDLRIQDAESYLRWFDSALSRHTSAMK